LAARSQTWFYGSSLAGTADSNPTGGMDVSLVSIVCYQVEVSATGRSLVQRRPTECDASECVRGTSKRRPCPERPVQP
jgi:hypothetical protein